MVNAHPLSRPVTGSLLRSGMPSSPRPVSAGRVHLAAMESAPFWARRYTRLFLRDCRGISEDAAETAELIVSELVTNAAQASTRDLAGSEPSYSEQADLRLIGLSLRCFHDRLLIEVSDTSPQPPVLVNAGHDAENGRGLMLVDAFSQEWGYYPDADSGKIVYSFLHLNGRRSPAPPAERPSHGSWIAPSANRHPGPSREGADRIPRTR